MMATLEEEAATLPWEWSPGHGWVAVIGDFFLVVGPRDDVYDCASWELNLGGTSGGGLCGGIEPTTEEAQTEAWRACCRLISIEQIEASLAEQLREECFDKDDVELQVAEAASFFRATRPTS
jgi:hypothetical protein